MLRNRKNLFIQSVKLMLTVTKNTFLLYLLTDYHNNKYFYKFLKNFFIIIVYVDNYNLIESLSIVEGNETISTLSSEVKELLILFTVKKIPIKNIRRKRIIILYNRFINNMFVTKKTK